MTRRGRAVTWAGAALALASVAWLVWFFPDPKAAWCTPTFAIGLFAFFFGREF